jgi:hypothetical protein
MWADGMVWRNPPDGIRIAGEALIVATGDRTDFWRETFYGFTHDTGHHLTQAAGPSFTAELRILADWQAQYDQAGLMLWADEAHWVKAGIEYVNGEANLACVVTNGKSDWSQMPLAVPAAGLMLRLNRRGDAVWLQYREDGDWRMFRLAAFPEGRPAVVGPMACSPSRAGLEVTFRDYRLMPLVSDRAY